jgi:hypothetical protein
MGTGSWLFSAQAQIGLVLPVFLQKCKLWRWNVSYPYGSVLFPVL